MHAHKGFVGSDKLASSILMFPYAHVYANSKLKVGRAEKLTHAKN